MKKPQDPRELAVAMISRSTCAVQVGAVIADKYGIFSWGSNHVGFDGMGCHAEIEALRKANRKRLKKATIFVAACRKRNGKTITAKPCPDCSRHIQGTGVQTVLWRDKEGNWNKM